MTSSDREILISINNGLERVEARQYEQGIQIAEIRKDISDMKQEQQMLRHDMENLQHSVYWIFAAIGIFLAALAVIPALMSRKSEPQKIPSPVIHVYAYPANIPVNATEPQKERVRP